MVKNEIVNAPCQEKGVDPETFFPDPTDTAKIHLAKSICGKCDVVTKSACLSFAFTHSINYGVFGGLTEDERKSVKRKGQRNKYKSYVSVVGEY